MTVNVTVFDFTVKKIQGPALNIVNTTGAICFIVEEYHQFLILLKYFVENI